MATLSQQAYEQIHGRIVSGHLQPGAVVSESILARDLGMSRTPVGEAVKQLARERLVEQVPRFGTIVRAVDRRELIELYEMREALESYAAGKAAERISATESSKLQVLCDAMQRIADRVRQAGKRELSTDELTTFLSADMAFHMVILSASGNRCIERAVTETRAVSRIFRMRRQKHDLAIVGNALRYHLAILKALKNADGPQASQLMAEHIAASMAQTLEQMQADELNASGGGQLPEDLPQEIVKELQRVEQEDV
ncbi:MAG: GntR family transcriptional regulator [Pirellulales bacterium]|nr:GntR family transcriptional regulator [Pirellulales bacterium]